MIFFFIKQQHSLILGWFDFKINNILYVCGIKIWWTFSFRAITRSDKDCLTAVAHVPQVVSTRGAFAVWCSG